MKIIVVGGGKVGRTLVEQLIAEGHDIAVIDSKSRVITTVTDNFDVLGVQGNGASYTVQQDAGVEEADLLIAVHLGALFSSSLCGLLLLDMCLRDLSCALCDADHEGIVALVLGDNLVHRRSEHHNRSILSFTGSSQAGSSLSDSGA